MSTQDEFAERSPSNETAGGVDDSAHRGELDALVAKLLDSPALVKAGVEILVPIKEDTDLQSEHGGNPNSILRAAAALQRRRCWTVFPSGDIICIPPR